MVQYKFEKFSNPNFPVYYSVQKGKGEIVTPHYHEGAEIIKVLGGEITVTIKTEKITFKSGDYIFIPPFCIHSAVGESEDTKIQGLVFELSLINAKFGNLKIQKILEKEKITEFLIEQNSSLYDELDRNFTRAAETYSKTKMSYRLDMLSCIFGICALLCEKYFIDDKNYEDYDRLAPVFEYISQNLNDNIVLSDLSGIINVCDDHLIRLFKKSVNKSPIKYINDLRLQNAMKLLINSDLSITQIAYKTGFSDPNYMTRVFKKALEVTPGQYRRKIK